MVRQIDQLGWLNMISYLMELDALVVVDKKMFLLSDRKHMLVLEEARVSDQLFCLELTLQVLAFPVHQGNVALFARQEQVLSVPGEVHRLIGGKVLHVEIENLVGILDS